MKILFLANELLQVCGVSKHLYHLVDGLQKNYPNNEYFIMTGGGNAIQKFQALGVPVIVNENLRHETRSITGYIKGIKEVYSFVKRNDIQIIHSHHHYSSSIAYKVSLFTKVVTIQTNHGLLQRKGLVNQFSSEHIVVLSISIKEILKKRLRNKQVHFIRHSFPISTKQIEKDNNVIRVISAGRIEKEKGFETYINAIILIKDKLPTNVEFYVAGSGSLESILAEIGKKANISINFLGVIEEFQKYLEATHILVFPSEAEYEGLPTILIEAILSENLVISSNFFGHSDILNDECAVIFEKGNSKDLSEKIIDSVTNYTLYRKKILKLKNEVEEFYKQKKVSAELVSLYEKTINAVQ